MTGGDAISFRQPFERTHAHARLPDVVLGACGIDAQLGPERGARRRHARRDRRRVLLREQRGHRQLDAVERRRRRGSDGGHDLVAGAGAVEIRRHRHVELTGPQKVTVLREQQEATLVDRSHVEVRSERDLRSFARVGRTGLGHRLPKALNVPFERLSSEALLSRWNSVAPLPATSSPQ